MQVKSNICDFLTQQMAMVEAFIYKLCISHIASFNLITQTTLEVFHLCAINCLLYAKILQMEGSFSHTLILNMRWLRKIAKKVENIYVLCMSFVDNMFVLRMYSNFYECFPLSLQCVVLSQNSSMFSCIEIHLFGAKILHQNFYAQYSCTINYMLFFYNKLFRRQNSEKRAPFLSNKF